jgi:Ca2+-binding EF-hand superfamily protein
VCILSSSLLVECIVGSKMSSPSPKPNESHGSKHKKHNDHGPSTGKSQILKTSTSTQALATKQDSTTANAPATRRKGVPGGGDKKEPTKKTDRAAGNQKKNEKRDRKPRKKMPRQNPLMMWLGYGPDVVLRDRKAIEVAQAIDLRQFDLRVLKVKFDEVDIDGSGTLDSQELFESVGENRTPLTDRLFELLDMSPTGAVLFDDYVRIIGTYCMFTKDEILKFCFRCFDHDDSGTIDEKEFCELCKVVNNAAPLFPGNFQKALDEFDVNEVCFALVILFVFVY